jgi:hypothetical protein
VTRIDDPAAVRDQYATETNLGARKSIYTVPHSGRLRR